MFDPELGLGAKFSFVAGPVCFHPKAVLTRTNSQMKPQVVRSVSFET